MEYTVNLMKRVSFTFFRRTRFCRMGAVREETVREETVREEWGAGGEGAG
jgi:hypothetical protein